MVSWNVQPLYGFTGVELGDNGLDWADKEMLSAYNKEMNSVIKAFKDWKKDADKDAYYLFVVPKFSESALEGFMPLGYSYGFVTKDQLDARTVAHCLSRIAGSWAMFVKLHFCKMQAQQKSKLNNPAYGGRAFALRHTFPEAPQGKTDNLMDYTPDKNALLKAQWDLIHNPENVQFAWTEDMEEGAMKELKGTYTIYVGDSIMTEKKVFINTNKTEKIYVKYEPAAGDTGTYINVKLIYRPVWSKNDISWPGTTWGKINVNTKTYFGLDSLPEGRYMVLLKNKDEKVDTLNFYLRPKKYDFACSVCGRNLVLTGDELKQIFPNSEKINNPDVINAFNSAFRKSGFKTCNHFAHFLAQIKTESAGLTTTTEGSYYYLHRMLEVFSGNNGTKFWYNQSFLDDKTYLRFTAIRVYEKMDSAKFDYSVDSMDFETFTHKSTGSSIIVPKDYPSHSGHTTAFNGHKLTKGKGYYKAVTLSFQQKEDNGKRLLNAAYSGMNENSSDTTMANAEGYKYRGRGFVQVTGKTNYLNAQNTCSSKFQLNYDFVNNPDLMKNDTIAVWASFAWFIKNIQISDLDTENPDIITYKVNAAGLEKESRRNNYNAIRQSIFKCNKP